jgi:HEAT repeat protein/beta-lactamase regulating signal transducer with metallopeptidase domain
VLSWLFTYAIHSTIVLAGAAFITRRLTEQHAWLDAAWKAALIGPLVTASLSLGPAAIPLSVPTGSHDVARRQAHERVTETTTIVERVSAAPPAENRAEGAPPVAPEQLRVAAWRPELPAWPSLGVIVWLLIAAALLGRYGFRLVRLYRTIGSGPSVTAPDLLRALDALRQSVRQPRSIRLTSSDSCPVPIALAGRHIVLPRQFLEQFDADEQRAALAHEVAHVLRRDPAWRITAAIVERVLFFQPLNRIARIRMTESAEFLCDQWAVQHTGSPLALARCLSMVASWASSANNTWAVGVSAMARSDSAMVRRVTQILNGPAAPSRRPRALWLAAALAVVAVAAPRVTATPLAPTAAISPSVQIQTPAREWTAAEIARAQAALRVYRPARPGDSLDARWRWALDEARRRQLNGFWIAYSFETPVPGGDIVVSDSKGMSFVSSDGLLQTWGPPLLDVLRDGGGNIVVLLHYRGTVDAAVDRAGFRSASVGFDFERAPVFWLGFADESQSFARVRSLFELVRTDKVQRMLIELASMHGNSNAVIPFLTQLTELSQPSGIRNEAAEGFGHHHDPRSVEILLRVARTDPLPEVRAEAAETLGEVQVPQAIPALTNLVETSDDTEVRREAAEAFADQPADQALPALERVIASSNDADVLGEAVEALGELEHPGAAAALTRIIHEHPDEDVVSEAIEALIDMSGDVLHPQILELAASGRTPRMRGEALDAIADAVADSKSPELLDRAEQVLERAIFGDPDSSVRMEALDALDKLPRDRELRMLRQVIERHPDARLRREAGDHLSNRRR